MNAKQIFLLAIAGMALGLTACSDNDANKATDTIDHAVYNAGNAAEKAVKDVRDAVDGNIDSNFVVKAILLNNKAMILLQAGIDNGSNGEIATDARTMLDHHKELGDRLTQYADKAKYPYPHGDRGRADDDLASVNKKARGSDWDKAWTDDMVDTHKDEVSACEKGRDNVKDPSLKALIIDILPTYRNHLDMMKNLKDKLNS